MAPDLPETCTVYGSVTRDRYGDFSLGSGTTESCLYRDVSLLSRGVNFREEVTIQGQFWLAYNSVAKEGNLIGYSGQLFRIEGLTNAKDLLAGDQLQFKKCLVSLYRGIS